MSLNIQSASLREESSLREGQRVVCAMCQDFRAGKAFVIYYFPGAVSIEVDRVAREVHALFHRAHAALRD